MGNQSALPKASLYFSEGGSDKEYHAEVIAVDGGNIVNFRYGRRGAALTCGSKTPAPVEFAQAEKIFLKLVKEKTSKGYTPDFSGESYQGTDKAGLKTDFVPQLLNAITEDEAMSLIKDDRWVAQEKMDGERRAAHADKGEATGMNRKGLAVPLPQSVADELNVICANGAVRLDAEIIGESLYVFDLHVHHGDSIRNSLGWLERMRLAEQLLKGYQQLKAVPVAVTTEEKHALWNKVKAARGEGLVFKLKDCEVKEGRPNSGGDWLKFKFVESASCIVMSINTGRRSVAIGLQVKTMPGHIIPVGNVTIPPNYDIPMMGRVVEVEYLYAFKLGSLYQPVYRGIRTDLFIFDCTTDQLKYKPEGRLDDSEDMDGPH